MRVELSKKTAAALEKVTDRGKEIGDGTIGAKVEFVLDRFLRRRQSIKEWQDANMPSKKSKKKSKKTAKKASTKSKPRAKAKGKSKNKPRPRKPAAATPPNGASETTETATA